jgi:hypothetical protein
MILIPLFPSLLYWEEIVELEGTDYLLRFYWRERLGQWFADIAEADGTLLVSGEALSLDYPLFAHRVNRHLPPGRFLVVDLKGALNRALPRSTTVAGTASAGQSFLLVVAEAEMVAGQQVHINDGGGTAETVELESVDTGILQLVRPTAFSHVVGEVVTSVGVQSNIGRADLGTNVVLTYLTDAEAVALRSDDTEVPTVTLI